MASNADDVDDDMPPLLNNHAIGNRPHDDDDDDDDLNDDVWGNDDDNDECMNSAPMTCLFCESSFPNFSDLESHSRSSHSGFELRKFAAKTRLDSIAFIQCVNYVRKKRISPEELMKIKTDFSMVRYAKKLLFLLLSCLLARLSLP